MSMSSPTPENQLKVLSTSQGCVLFQINCSAACWDVLGTHLAVISARQSTVSVHDGLSGDRLACWCVHPVPRFFSQVLRLRWVPDSAALVADLYFGASESDDDHDKPGCPSDTSALDGASYSVWLRLSFAS